MRLPAVADATFRLARLVFHYPYLWALVALVDALVLVYLWRRGNRVLLALWTAFVLLLSATVFVGIHLGLAQAAAALP
jgi:hypothetical protein